MKESELTLDNFYNDLLGYLEASPLKNIPEEFAEITPLHISEFDMILTYFMKDKKNIDLFKFEMHQKVLKEFWQANTKNGTVPFDFKVQGNLEALENALSALKNDAKKLHSLLPYDKLIGLQATIQELEPLILQEQKRLKKESKQVESYFLPEPIQKKFQEWGLTSDVLLENKKTLVWAFGNEAGDLIDQLSLSMSKMPPLPPVQEVSKGWLSSLFSLTYIHTAFCALKIAYKLANLSLTDIPIFLVFKCGNALLKYILPEPILKWYLRVVESIQETLSDYIWKVFVAIVQSGMGKEDFAAIKTSIEYLQNWIKYSVQSLTGDNKISFDISSNSVAAHPPKFNGLSNLHRELGSTADQEELNLNIEAKLLPKTHDQALLLKNLKSILDDTVDHIDAKETLIHLLNQIECMEIPSKGKQSFWDTVENPLGVIEALFNVSKQLCDCGNPLSTDLKLRTALASYTLLAAMDTLARRNPNAFLDGFPVNAFPLLSLLKHPSSVITNPQILEKGERLCAYFFPTLDIEDLPPNIYADNRVKNLKKKSLFDYHRDRCNEFEKKYFEKLLKTPKGIAWYSSVEKEEKFSLPVPKEDISNLIYDQEVVPTSFRSFAYKTLFQESFHVKNRWDLIPKEFTYLKYQTLISNNFLTSSLCPGQKRILTQPLDVRTYKTEDPSFCWTTGGYDYKESYDYELFITPLEGELRSDDCLQSDLLAIKPKYTQHYILGSGDLGCSNFRAHDSEINREFNKIFTESSDKIPRFCEFLLRHKTTLCEYSHNDFLTYLEKIFYSKDTKTLLTQSPEFALTLVNTLHAIQKDYIASKKWKWALVLIGFEISLQRFIACYASQYQVDDCTHTRDNLKLILKESQPNSVYIGLCLRLYALSFPDDLSTLPQEEQDEAIVAMLRARFSPRKSIHENLLEKFYKWAPTIQEKLNSPEFVQALTTQLLHDRKIEHDSPAVYNKKLHLISSGEFVFHMTSGLFACNSLKKVKVTEEVIVPNGFGSEAVQTRTKYIDAPGIEFRLKQAEELAKKVFSSTTVHYVGKNLFKTADDGVEIVYDELANSLIINRQIFGKTYSYVGSDIPHDLYFPLKLQFGSEKNIWMEKTDAIEKWLLIETKDKQFKKVQINSRTNQVLKVDNGEEILEHVDKEQLGQQLRSLERYTSLDPIKCWKRVNENHLRYIVLNNSQHIEIEEKEGQIQSFLHYGTSIYQLSSDTSHKAVEDISSFLILQTGSGEKEVFIPEGQSLSALLTRGLSQTNLKGPILRMAQEVLGNFQKGGKKDYRYRILADGCLDSDDPEAIAYLVTLYFIQGKKKLAERVCKKFVTLSKLKQFPEGISRILFPLVIAPPNFENATYIRQRLVASLEENRLIFPKNEPPKKEKSENIEEKSEDIFGEEFFEFLLIGSSFIDLHELQSVPEQLRKITKKQEYFLFHFLFRRFQSLIEKKSYLKNLKMEMVFEVFNISPELVQRYRELKATYGFQDSWKDTATRVALHLPTADRSLPTQTIGLPSSDDKSSVFTDWKKHIKENYVAKAFEVSADLFPKMKSVKKDDLPLNYHEITENDIVTHFLSYYAIVRGEESEESPSLKVSITNTLKNAFSKIHPFYSTVENVNNKVQKETFSKTLKLLKGSFSKEVNVLINYLEAVDSAVDSVVDSALLSYPSSSLLEKALKNPSPNSRKEDINRFFSDIYYNIKWSGFGKNVFKTVATAVANVSSSIGFINQFNFIPKASSIKNILFQATTSIAQSAAEVWNKSNIPVPAKSAPIQLPEKSYAFLDDENSAIDKLFGSLFSKAFINYEPPENSTDQQRVPNLTSAATSESEKERFARVNKSLDDYYKRNNIKPKYLFLGNDSLWEMVTEAHNVKSLLENSLENQRKELLSFLNPPHLPKSSKLTLADLHYCIIKGKLDKIGAQLNMDVEDLSNLEALFLRYVSLQARLNQLNRVLTHFDDVCSYDQSGTIEKYAESLEKLAIELSAKREYSFDKLPRRLMYCFSLFEWATNILLTPKQTDRITMLYTEDNKNVVQELIMIFGKTFFGVPTIDAMEADGSKNVFNVWPDGLAATNTRDISTRGDLAFKQVANVWQMDRYTKRMKENYEALIVLLQGTMEEGETLNCVKTDLQATESNFIELCYLQTKKSSSEGDQVLGHLQNILSHIRKTSMAVGDEGHHLFNHREELIFPIGEKESLPKKSVLTIERCFKTILEDPQVKKLLNDNEMDKFDEGSYFKKVVPAIAKTMSEQIEYNLTDTEKELFIKYVSGKTDIIPPELQKHARFDEIALIRGFILKLFKKALTQSVNLHFGRSHKDPNNEHAKPYRGNNNPLENCSILSPYEDLVKTMLTYLHEGLQTSQISRLINYLKNDSKKEAKQHHKSEENTQSAKLFKSWLPNFSLETASSKIAEVLHAIEKNTQAIFLYIRLRVAAQIHYWPRCIRSNAQNFASMFLSLYFDTGTPYNDGSYHHSLKMLNDPGTTGEALDVISKKCPADGIHQLQSKTPKQTLKEVLKKFFVDRNDFSLLVDGGALLKGISNEKVVKSLIKIVDKKRPDIKGIVFFKNVDGKDLLVYRDIASGKDSPFVKDKYSPKTYLTYFDQIHGFGSDAPQSGSAVDLVGSQPLYSLLQEAFRLRSIKNFQTLYFDKDFVGLAKQGNQQQIHFAMSEETAQKISPGKDSVTLMDLITYVTAIEAKQAEEDNYQSYKLKVHDIVRRAILDKLIFAPSTSQLKAIFSEFEDFLIPKSEYDPVKLFGWIEMMENTHKVLDKYENQLYKVIEKSKWFTEEDKFAIKTKMRNLPRYPMPKEVPIAKNGDEINVDPADFLNLEATVDVNNESENNNEKDNDINQEKDVSTQQGTPTKYKETPWPYFNPRTLDWFDYNTLLPSYVQKVWSFLHKKGFNSMPNLYRVPEILKESSLPFLKQMAKEFDERIWFSNHYLPQTNNGLFTPPAEFGSKEQCDLFEVVVHYEQLENGKLKIHSVGCLTQKEADQWKKALAAGQPSDNGLKAMVYDVYTRSPVAGDIDQCESLKFLPDFQKLEVQLRFLNKEPDCPKELHNTVEEWFKGIQPTVVYGADQELNREKPKSTVKGSDMSIILAKLMNTPVEEAI